MKVVHLLPAGVSRYDRACAAIDLTIASGVVHELFEAAPGGWMRNGAASSLDELDRLVRSEGTALVHLHGSEPPPKRLLSRLGIPWITDRRVAVPRSFFGRIPGPAAVLVDHAVPEAAGEEWFIERPARGRGSLAHVGAYVRDAVTRNNAEQVAGRIQRFRDDVEWVYYETPPTPDQLAALDLWVDPAAGEDDVEGMVVEAIACRTPVVAARMSLNRQRLDEGRAGLLPPLGDHNEMTHAVLSALFKEEVIAPLRLHAERIRDRFRPAQRRAAVERVYREVVR